MMDEVALSFFFFFFLNVVFSVYRRDTGDRSIVWALWKTDDAF